MPHRYISLIIQPFTLISNQIYIYIYIHIFQPTWGMMCNTEIRTTQFPNYITHFPFHGVLSCQVLEFQTQKVNRLEVMVKILLNSFSISCLVNAGQYIVQSLQALSLWTKPTVIATLLSPNTKLQTPNDDLFVHHSQATKPVRITTPSWSSTMSVFFVHCKPTNCDLIFLQD